MRMSNTQKKGRMMVIDDKVLMIVIVAFSALSI